MRNQSPLFSEIRSYLEPGAASPGGAALARILSMLVSYEIEEGGPYASTVADIPIGQAKCDLGFNLVAALFLRNLNVRLPKLDAYITQELSKQSPASRLLDIQELAACIESYRFSEAGEPAMAEAQNSSPNVWTAEELALLTKMRAHLERRLAPLPREFQKNAWHVIERTIRGNPDKQMSLIPLFMRQALGERGGQFSDQELAELSLANVFFWTAFIIYDDFWDEDEAAETKHLPIANLFARQYVGYFSSYAPGTDFIDYFHTLMDKLDAANEWEIMSCRMKREGNAIYIPDKLPRYGNFDIKFYPAAGQVLGPVGMLLKLGYGEKSAEVEALVSYFKHYLIAMQLNDDAHDWKEDLERGHISTAVSLLLAAWRIAHPERTEIDIMQDLPELERLFWFETLAPLCDAILEHTDEAQRSLDALCDSSCVTDPAPLQQFIDRNRTAAEQAQDEQRRSIAFLEAIETAEKTQI